MQIDAPLLIALGAIITSILTFISSINVSKRAARKDEVQLLRDEVIRLQKRIDELMADNDGWRKKYELLFRYVLILRRMMIDKGMSVPAMESINSEETVLLPENISVPSAKE